LVGLTPDVIVADGTPVIAALEQATHSIPIVFVVVNDPVEQGFIASLAHPGGNVTGFSFIDFSQVRKVTPAAQTNRVRRDARRRHVQTRGPSVLRRLLEIIRDHAPVLALSGDMPRKMHGTDLIPETVASPSQAPAVIHQAIAAAYAGRRCPPDAAAGCH
jgi:hypothetical protein